MKKKHLIYLYSASVFLFVLGVIFFISVIDWWGLSVILLIIGIGLFTGTTVYYITCKIKSSKKRIIFYICDYILSLGLLLIGIGSQIYAENYKEYGGFMPGLDALGDWIGNVFCIVLGLIIVIGITGSIIVRKTVNKKHIQKGNQ